MTTEQLYGIIAVLFGGIIALGSYIWNDKKKRDSDKAHKTEIEIATLDTRMSGMEKTMLVSIGDVKELMYKSNTAVLKMIGDLRADLSGDYVRKTDLKEGVLR